jgi:hypothetical protein
MAANLRINERFNVVYSLVYEVEKFTQEKIK